MKIGMKLQPIDLEELEKTILSYFDREKERLLKEERERPDLSGYFAGRKEECSVMRRTIMTHLKREIKQRVKSAVKGLLNDIEKKQELYVPKLGAGLEIAKYLIKKWFKDVIE